MFHLLKYIYMYTYKCIHIYTCIYMYTHDSLDFTTNLLAGPKELNGHSAHLWLISEIQYTCIYRDGNDHAH